MKYGSYVRERDAFYSGVMAALACVYAAGKESLAEEIVRTCGEKDLLRVARLNDDPWLADLKETVRYLRARRRAAR